MVNPPLHVGELITLVGGGVPGNTGPVGPQGIQGIQGPKGDPGGWVVSSNIADNVNLDTLLTPGSYFRASATGTTTALNYPVNNWAGWIEVLASTSGVRMQRATSTSSRPDGSNNFEGNTWFRTHYANVWQPWLRIDTRAHEAAADPHPQYQTKNPTTLVLPIDLNTVVASGRYAHGYNASNANVPVGDGGFLDVLVHPNGLIAQRWESAAGRTFSRKRSGAGAWGAWAEETMLNHVNAADPHNNAGYARKSVANTFTAVQTISAAGSNPLTRIRSDNPANARRWDEYIDSTGYLGLIAKTDAGANQGVPLLLHRDGRASLGENGKMVQLGGVQFHVGTGFPEGVVIAPPGSKYTDKNATNGAVEWVKATGVGGTGWRVTFGDTGWVNLTGFVPEVSASASGNCRARRINSTVYLTVDVVTTSAWVPGTAVMTLPSWANPGLTYMPAGYAGQQWWLNGNELRMTGGSAASPGRRTGVVALPTGVLSWPTELTGV